MVFTKKSEEANTIEVTRVNQYKEIVFFDATINGVTIYGLKFMTEKKGDFVAFPQVKGKDKNGADKWFNICWVKLTDEDVKNIETQLKKLLECE